MHDYQRILVALELGEDGRAVAARARDVAQRYGAAITLLHVIEPLPTDAAAMAMLPPTTTLEPELSERAEAELSAIARETGLTQARRVISVGYTKHEILTLAEDWQADLIVVGSHGRHGLALLLGSTANALLHGARCDVLAVRI